MSAAEDISDRLDRLTFSRWHARILGLTGAAHFFDAFDALTIAFILPVLISEWGLNAFESGLLLATGYAGQIIGAVTFGRLAARYGRKAMLVTALCIIATFSLASAMASGLIMFAVLRFVQGVGLGGEMPVAATYVNEVCPAASRGRIVLALQSLFALGAVFAACVAVYVIPNFGWRAMLLLGGFPFVLALLVQFYVPESPRWLTANGQAGRAESIVAGIEAQGAVRPPPTSQAPRPVAAESLPAGNVALLGPILRGRTLTLWALAVCIAVAGYMIVSWMPTLYRTHFHLPLRQALAYSVATMVTGFLGAVAAMPLIDRFGRRPCFIAGFVGGALPLAYLAVAGIDVGPEVVAVCASLSHFFLAVILCGLYIYAPELYPTSVRAFGVGTVSACIRLGAVISPIAVGVLLSWGGPPAAFLLAAAFAAVGAVVMILFGRETAGRPLDL